MQDRKSPQDMFRPLLSSVPSTMSYVGKVNSAHHSLVSRNSSVTTNINASSDQGTSFAVDTQGSDHNHDDMASETDKILYHDIHEELFAFDKIDELNANGESIDIQHNETRDPKIVFGPTESEHSVRHGGIDAEVNENSETSCNQGDIYETGNSENTAICSHCGCSYEATEQDEKDVALCPECSRKLLRVIIPETTLAVSKDSSLISKYIPEEEKSLSLSETNQLTVASELPQDTDVGDLRFRFGEQDAEECQTSCSELIHDHSQNSPLPSSSEGGVEMNRPGVDYEKANNEFGDQKLYRYSAPPNFNVNLKEGSDFSVLLHRSSSNQGPELQQGRSFTATTMSYDDLSLARDSKNSNRSSRRDGSYSASSSVDYGSVRHTELRVQRLLSGRKLDVDCGYDLQVKPPSTGSSFSGTSNHSHHELVLATREISGDIECGFVEDIPGIIRGMQASEITVIDVTDASSVSLIGVKEDKFELDDTRRPTNACSSEISIRTAVVQSDDNSVASFPNLGDCISYEKVEDDPNNLSVSSFHEKRDVLNSYVDVRDALVTTNSCTIVESEIEGGKNYCENNTGTVNDDMSLVEKSALDECQELSAQNPSNDCLTASVSEVNTSKYSHGIEGVTITAECQGAGNTRSLTLEEATDTILFCSSIIHDLAHQAASTALEKEYSDDPFEGSQPAMTLLGKSNSNREDTHSRVVCKHASKLHKAKQRRVVENNVKPSSGMTKNDENIDESFTHDNNDGLPEKVDSNMKLPKLESKCSCIIM
ncbi:hypothetical protein Lalb_Chr11g0075701 [Lupinus albus]|uniref:Uncharacterized protein n=1 Tax=Lupinus albus TaxID=3870 RepID=A0A6A4PTP7_LUPAL|nr:hypothetical protein Lalb_Chr11g0075701 [Lupinus albus]